MNRALQLSLLAGFGYLLLLPASGFAEKSIPRAKELIQKFDADADGKLDRAELDQALLSLVPQKREYVRVLKNSKGTPVALETSVSSLESEDGELLVDLIGAIHVGDRSYYEALNDRFKDYDVVLYELVAPEGARVPKAGQKSQHPVGRMQQGIKTLLDLSYQLDYIDYRAANLVHADMSPDEFAKSMQDRGESFLQMFFRMMGQAAAQAGNENAPSDTDFLLALLSSDRALKLKRVMAKQFQDMESQMRVIDGPNGSTLLGERNKKALQVLQQEIEKGHKKIGIFYGAGHMPDMEKRLQVDFELRPTKEDWVQAWDMSTKKK